MSNKESPARAVLDHPIAFSVWHQRLQDRPLFMTFPRSLGHWQVEVLGVRDV